MKRQVATAALAIAALFAPGFAAAEEAAADVVCVELTRSMGFGATDAAYGGEVSALQGFLARVGALASEPTGYFGLLTRDAVIAFQESNDIQATGAVDQVTRDVIRRQSCARGEMAAVAQSGKNTVKAGTVTFDLTPVPDRSGPRSSPSGASGKLKVVMKTSTVKTADGGARVAVSVAPRSTNERVEIWDLAVDCNRGVAARAGSRDVCGQTLSKYAYAIDDPNGGFALASLELANTLQKRNTVTLRLSARDADGNVMSKESKRVRVSAAPAAEE